MHVDKRSLYIFSAISGRIDINRKTLYKFYNILQENIIEFQDVKEEKYKNIIKDFLQKIDKKTNFENILEIFNNKKIINEIEYSIEKSIEFCDKNDIKILTLLDKNYPEKLMRIERPPYILFLKGKFNYSKLFNSFALVGTRKPSQYGIDFCNNIAKYISENNYLNISGLARGSDTIGHKICIKNTAAILGYGLAQNTYPKENEELVEEILLNNGFIASENLPYDTINVKNLIDRNRIITALSDNLVIVETSLKGGTIHSFKFAKKQNKNIFINSICSEFIEKNKKYVIVIENERELKDKLNLLKMKKMKQQNMFE